MSKVFCPKCYDGWIVKDKITGVMFCCKCFKEFVIPVFEKDVNFGKWKRPCEHVQNDFYRG